MYRPLCEGTEGQPRKIPPVSRSPFCEAFHSFAELYYEFRAIWPGKDRGLGHKTHVVNTSRHL